MRRKLRKYQGERLWGELRAAKFEWRLLRRAGCVSQKTFTRVLQEAAALRATWAAVECIQGAIQAVKKGGEMEREIPVTSIRRSRWQPRDSVFDAEALWSLASSIRENGLLNAVQVFVVTEACDDDQRPAIYELVAGERRTRAVLGIAWAEVDVAVTAKEAVTLLAQRGLDVIPQPIRNLLTGAIIRARVLPNDDLAQLHVIAALENFDREDLTPIEEGRAFHDLMTAYGWSQRECARRLGKSQGYVAQRVSLLSLTPAAQEAVNTRVLTATHARSLSAVPTGLQEAATSWAVDAVSRDDTPATTRQVQNQLRALAAFVDPERWTPNAERVYRPEEHNRLGWLAWAIGQADLEAVAEKVLGLAEAEVGWRTVNLLTMSPSKLVGDARLVRHVLAELGVVDARTLQETAWAMYAAKTQKTCEFCRFEGTEGADAVRARAHCSRWRGEQVETCEGFIGRDDPVVIPIERYPTAQLLQEAGVTVAFEPFPHFGGVREYTEGQRVACEALEAQKMRHAEVAQTRHLPAMRAYWAWVQARTRSERKHFQAHACEKCKYYQPLFASPETPPCAFAGEPLVYQYNGETRAPEYAVWVREDGFMVPRCEMFVYAVTPPILGMPVGIVLPNRDQVLEWLRGLQLQTFYTSSFFGVRPVVAWLDYGQAPGKHEVKRLQAWLKAHWEDVGGDPGMATVLDVVLSEECAMRSKMPMTLLNPVTRDAEVWAGVGWNLVTHGRKPLGWPEGYPVPWPGCCCG